MRSMRPAQWDFGSLFALVFLFHNKFHKLWDKDVVLIFEICLDFWFWAEARILSQVSVFNIWWSQQNSILFSTSQLCLLTHLHPHRHYVLRIHTVKRDAFQMTCQCFNFGEMWLIMHYIPLHILNIVLLLNYSWLWHIWPGVRKLQTNMPDQCFLVFRRAG